MGYFDGLTASAFKEEDGQWFIIGFGKPRRFLSREDYELARRRLSTYYSIGLPLIVVLVMAGRQFGFGWAISGSVILLGWFMIFGRQRLISNTVPGDVTDGARDRLDRMGSQLGRGTLWLLLASSAVLASIGFLLLGSGTEHAVLGLVCFAFFGIATAVFAVMLIRARGPSVQPIDDLARLEKLADLRDRGVLSEAEFVALKGSNPLGSGAAHNQAMSVPMKILLGAGLLTVGLGSFYVMASKDGSDDGINSGSGTSGDLSASTVAAAEFQAQDFVSSEGPSQSVAPAPIEKSTGSAPTDPAWTNEELSAIVRWEALNEHCRGGSGDQSGTLTACNERDEIALPKLRSLGICYGREGESGYEMAVHRCGSDSLR